MPIDYLEAMQNPRDSLGDPELQFGRAEEDKLGLPRPRGGAFASVYKFRCGSRWWAVRCFLREFLDQQDRYAAISAQLAISKFPFAIDFKFLKQGIKVRGSWYPIIKMEWVQGEDFIRYIETNLRSPQKLDSLARDIVDTVRTLTRANVAHGDLQHGNILIANGKPKLIDYDGMYVPALKNWKTHEAGHPNYQLPRDENDFGPGLDNFSVWVIYLSLRALSIQPSLWTQYKGGDDCLLFRRKDYESPAQSLLLKELKTISELRSFIERFEFLLNKKQPLQVELIDPDSSPHPPPKTGPLPDWLNSHVLLRPNNTYKRPSVAWGTIPNPWPTTLARVIPAKPAMPNILVSPPVWPGPIGLPPRPPQPPVPSILHSPPEWRGPLDPLPEEPIWTGVIAEPPPAIKVPPMKHRRQYVAISQGQRAMGLAALSCGALIVLILPIAVLVAIANARFAFGAVVVELVPLFGMGVFGGLWYWLERARSESEHRLNKEYDAEIAELRAAARRKKKEWEAKIAENEALARREYEHDLQAWKAECVEVQVRNQMRIKQFQEEIAAKQAHAQSRYDQELWQWKKEIDAIQAESLRQKREWEAEQAYKKRQAQQQYDQELQRWQDMLSAMRAEKSRRETAVANAQQRLDAAEQNWRSVADQFVIKFDKEKNELDRLRTRQSDVKAQQVIEENQLIAQARERQFADHLRKELVEVAAISDIGEARRKTLQQYGIRTAWDVEQHRILQIPGFGPVLTANLMEWRRNVEATFLFKRASAISPQEEQALKSKYDHLCQTLQQQINDAEARLKKIFQDSRTQLHGLMLQIETLLVALKQAEADLGVIPNGL